jgi:hypothetical protein
MRNITKRISILVLAILLLVLPIAASELRYLACWKCGTGRITYSCGGMTGERSNSISCTKHNNCTYKTAKGYTRMECSNCGLLSYDYHTCYQYHTNGTAIEVCPYGYPY